MVLIITSKITLLVSFTSKHNSSCKTKFIIRKHITILIDSTINIINSYFITNSLTIFSYKFFLSSIQITNHISYKGMTNSTFYLFTSIILTNNFSNVFFIKNCVYKIICNLFFIFSICYLLIINNISTSYFLKIFNRNTVWFFFIMISILNDTYKT